jgi:hypothetical protein
MEAQNDTVILEGAPMKRAKFDSLEVPNYGFAEAAR